MSSPSFPTRLLFLIDELDVGGTEQQLLELVRRLDRRHYLPFVCCFRPGRVAEEIKAIGVPVFTVRKRAKVDPALVLSLVRLMRRERIDLAQTYLFTANTWGRLAAILARVPFVVSSERNVDMWRPLYKRAIVKFLDRWTCCTIANSEAVRDYLISRGIPAGKVRLIRNGVDLARFDGSLPRDAIKAELGIPPHHSVVGFLARLEEQKDPHTFLRAVARLGEKNSAVSFLLIGGGTLEPELRREAGALGLEDRVRFVGPRRDIPRLLAACDVSVLSSVREGMSNTLMESMAAGKPVVATRVGGNAELIQDGETGFLVPARDPAALADAVQRILDDPALTEAMQCRAKARITEQFSVDAMVAATERLYDNLVRSAAQERSGASPVISPTSRDDQDGSRIALVVSQFPRHVDAYLLREIKGLVARGLRFRIFSLQGFESRIVHGDARPFLADTVYVPFLFSWRIVRAQTRMLGRTPARYLGALATLIKGGWRHPRSLVKSLAVFPKSVYFATLVQDERMSHIHANWATHPASSALVMSKLTGVAWSFAGHASDIYLDTTMLPEKIHAAKFVVTCTKHNKEYLVRVAGPHVAHKVIVCYHGVDLAKFKPRPRPPAAQLRVLAVGTLIECKGFRDLVEACGVLAGRNVPFECTIVGGGPERRPLERLIRRMGLADRVKVTGYVAQEGLIRLYQEASVIVLPARSDRHFGIPNVLLESLAVETPIVCTPLPSLAEVVEDGRHGLYVPERSPKALANALETLARDPERGRAMGEAGRRRIEAQFDVERTVPVLEALLRSGGESPVGVPEVRAATETGGASNGRAEP